ARGDLHLDYATLEKLIIRDQRDGEGIWGRWNANGPGTARLFHELQLGSNFDNFDQAKPGDCMKIFWSRQVGKSEHAHSTIFVGIIAFVYPRLTIAVLVLLFGAWVLVDGVFRVIGAIGHRASDPDWGFHLIIRILGIIIGFLTFHAPRITALALVIYIAAWALMIGATEIALAVRLRREIKGEWFLILMGLASLVFAFLLLWNPVAGAAA